MRVHLPLVLFPLAAAACASQGTRPDDMSHEAHEESAAAHAAEAQAHRDQYDAKQTTLRVSVAERLRQVESRSAGADFFWSLEEYNPTAHHKQTAAKHDAHAKAHARAAEKLAAYEEGACKALAKEARASCPLLGQLAAVEDVEGGARLTFANGVDPDALAAHLACHHAFGQSGGFEGMDGCPLYEKRLRIDSVGDDAIELLVDDIAARDRVRAAARAHLP